MKRRRTGQESGATAVETALAITAFFMLLFPLFDFGRSFFSLVTVRHAVGEAVRLAVSGETITNPQKGEKSLSRADSIAWTIRNVSGLTIPNSGIAVSSVDSSGAKHSGPGGPGDLVTVEVTYDLPIVTPLLRPVFPGGVYRVQVKSTARNEQFPAAS